MENLAKLTKNFEELWKNSGENPAMSPNLSGEKFESMEIENNNEGQTASAMSFNPSGENFDGMEIENSNEGEIASGSSEAFQEILSSAEVVQCMLKCIHDVNNVIEIPETTTRILLNHFRWDKDKLMDKFFESDQEALFKAAHVVSPHATIRRQSQATNSDCEICFLQYPQTSMTGLQCGHLFCKPCLEEYLKAKIMGEGVCESISCASNNCDILVDDVTVMNLLSDPQILTKYQQFITNNFVQSSKLLRWCPSPNCSFAVKVLFNEAQEVKCKCGHIFCFECGEQWHEPAKCDTLRNWIKKGRDESQTNTEPKKNCPNCFCTLEKNMICSKQSCMHKFCWVCLAEWHVQHICNVFVLKKAAQQSEARDIHTRYLHYFSRYTYHRQSLMHENKIYSAVQKKMEEMQNLSYMEVEFMNTAVTSLFQCRQTLMYSYVFAFYQEKTNELVIFEDNLKNLEMATEILNEYLKRALEDYAKNRQKVIDKYRYCENRRAALLKHVRDGYDNDLWKSFE